MARGAVSVTTGTGGTGICANKAVSGPAPGFTALGPIVVTEGLNTDFATGTATLVLLPPAGWQFSAVLPSLTFITGSNITAISGSITSTALTVNVTVSSTTGADQFTVSGLQVQPLTTSAPAGNIYTSSATGISGISTGSSGTLFAPLSVTAAVSASVSIAASPSGAFCPGTTVVFTPTPVNGGTPTYTWAVNGIDVAIGSSYTNSSLLNGNTVSCKMLSSLGCLTANPVFSSVYTATVLVAPGPITGPTSVCPGNTITQVNATGGGMWSSTNTAVGTISSGGVVGGVSAGTTTISYSVGGCAATRTIFVNNHPFAPVLTPTAAAICNGTTLAMAASGTPAAAAILAQSFNSGLGAWTVDTTGSINILPGAEWKACADSYLNEQGWYRSPDHSVFFMANADTSGSSSTLVTRLTSPSFSLADYTSATLTFQHAYDYWPAGDVFVNLEISTNGGSSWSPIINFKGANIGSKMSFASQSFSLNSYLGYPNVKIRFLYHSSFGYYWALDNVMINGVAGVVTPTWSPLTYLYTDAAHTVPYTGGATNTVYMHPASVSSPTPVTYTATAAAGGCAGVATTTITVNPSPGTMSGALNMCVGTGTVLTNSAAGGTWVSGNTSVATVGSATGAVMGLAVGTAPITYVLGSTCTAVAIVTVNITPAPITGNANVCLGYFSPLADVTTGGTWSSDNLATAPVNTTTGQVYGLAPGTANITYSLGAGCSSSITVTVQPLPAAVTGPSTVCATQSITLGNATGGGTWASSTTGVATVGAASGVVTGVAGGTADISYILTATGCFAIRTVSVNPQAPITGPPSICVGTGATLLNSEAGGTWASGTPSVATINATSGDVSALVVGTTSISYTLPSGCRSVRDLTVDPIPADITGPSSVCLGRDITLGNVTPGGSWVSGNPAVASVGSSTGIVSGGAVGTALISYVISTGCYKTRLITVAPVPAAITGTAAVCEGGTTVLLCATGGGTWASSNSNATVTNGTVGGVTAGSVTITYTIPNTCFATRSVTVNPLPLPITGTLAVCQALSSTLTSASPGGSWSSSNTVVATIGTGTGVITGGAAGNSNITYTLPTGCIATAVATVNTLPGTLTGPSFVCTGASVTLTSVSTGGSWSSGNAALGTVSASGVVTGVAAGAVNITYTLPTGCVGVKALSVYTSPAAITGSTNVCEGQATLLSSATTGGGWTSANTATATVGPSSGIVAGVAAGTTTITYMVVTGCIATATINVMALPAPITGSLNVCPGTTSALGSSPSGGTWTSSNTATIGAAAATGIISGILPGTSSITYTLPTGCYATATAVCNVLPADISGPSSVCIGSSVILTNATGGGSWMSADGALATIGSSTGILTGVAAATVGISYILPTGCAAVKTITVNPLPAAISGPANICQGATATMSSSPAGGAWSSLNPAVVSMNVTSGDMFGMGGGPTTITYTLGTGCRSTLAVSVTPSPSPIVGLGSICVGSNALFTSGTSGGSWLSGNTAVATVSAGGLVAGIAPGTSIISYVLPLGCMVTKLVSVNIVPNPITGNTSLCIGTPSTLSSTTPSGSWSSSNPTIASVSAGVVNGYILNTATITYMLPTGCYRTAMVTVNLTPTPITGVSGICEGASALFTNGVISGTWSSSNAAAASVTPAGGVVSGMSAGTALISYTVYTGCTATKLVTIHAVPAAVSGPSAVCAGLNIAMTNATTGGTWSSSNTAVGTVGSLTGIVTGLTAGTANIIYMVPAGCMVSAVVTVHALPGAISGASNVCLGATSLLSSPTGGGTWTSSNTAVATINTSGFVSGLMLGTSNITYTLGVGCFVSRTITVQPLPAAIAGSVPTCPGIGITLTNSSTGGAWSSVTSPGIATINAFSGVVSPLAPGTAIITYTLPTGCKAYTTVTVNTILPLSGPSAICVGVPTTYSHTVPGGTWSTSNSVIAGVGPATGLVVGFTASTVTISYTMPGGCVASALITLNPAPSAISGTASVCPGFSTALTSSPGGGIWSSTNTSFATVGISSGIASGIAPGILSISYTLPTGCAVSRLFTVNAFPAAIAGSASVCTGNTTALAIAATGGTWSSSATAVGTVNATTGLVAGIAAGTTAITYTPVTGCVSVIVVTVNSQPAAITGTAVLCNGATTTLADATAGGSWSSANTALATVAATGVVTAVGAGTVNISYTTPAGCFATRVVTVNVQPTAMTGVPSICVGYTTTLASSPGGGTWTSGNTAVATVPAGIGLISGMAAGTSPITYRLASGCRVVAVVTVSAAPATIAGPAAICEGLSAAFTDPALGGGTWSSSNTAVATIGSLTGVANAIATGTATITYMIGSGCISVVTVSVNPVPAPITGIANACIGMTTTLSCTTPAGTWSSQNAGIAAAGAASGIIAGIASGTTNIYYTLATGCRSAMEVTVNPVPAAITGVATVCEGAATALVNSIGGGSWTSSNAAIGTISATGGIVSGIAAGNAHMTYTLGAGCFATREVTVHPLPAAITGSGTVCNGLTATLANATAGATWSSAGSAVSVNSATGAATGLSAGIATISYTLPTGCYVTRSLTVNPLEGNTGAATTCVGFTTTLANSVAGGTWSSSSPGIASVDAVGLVSGLVPGTTTVSYLLPTGCVAETVVTITALSAISGPTAVCVGQDIALANPAPGGTWSTSAPAVASVSATGVVAGGAPGTAYISYTYGTGCMAAVMVTVHPLSAIAGPGAVCAGLSITLSNAIAGGTWSTASPHASVEALTGIVTGISAGTAAISYMLPTGCTAVKVVTVNALAPISGSGSLCVGLSLTLSNAAPGGSWTSLSPGIANISATSGVVLGVSPGTAVISYTHATGCASSFVVTVHTLPSAITGSTQVCAGLTTALSNTTPGGSWLSSNLPVATVSPSSGVAAGVTAGTSVISYKLPTGCYATTVFTVHPLPPAIGSTLQVCPGAALTLTNSVAGGTWSSASVPVAMVNAVSGIADGIAPGTAVITYRLATSCINTAVLTVNPLPGLITGAAGVCTGSVITLASSPAGGTWSTASATVLVDAATGAVAGGVPGTAVISYTLPTGCYRTYTLNVFSPPSATTGPSQVCVGATAQLLNATTGGSWSSSHPAIASIGAGSGLVTAIAPGTAVMSYSQPTGCTALYTITVNPLPAALSGLGTVCAGSSITLTAPTSGGAWSSGAASVATVSGAGVVAGVSAGVVAISYTLPTGCRAIMPVTVNPLPAAITGPLAVCVAQTITLANTVSGGAWVSGSTPVATVDAGTGIVTGVAPGLASITYVLSTGCARVVTVTVNFSPAPVTGPANVCAGAAISLASATAGGVWSSGAPAVAGISAAGSVNGITAGTSRISYTLPVTGCRATMVVTVNPLPPGMGGIVPLCPGTSAYLTNAAPGGTWSSTSAFISIGSADGHVTGITPGFGVVTYTLPTGCLTVGTIPVNPLPAPVTGTATACVGSATTLSTASTGGTWVSSLPGIATVTATGGVVSGIAAGVAAVSYVLPTGCASFVNVTINPVPPVITGATSACLGATMPLVNTVPGGTWLSGNTAIVSVGSSSGLVTGIALGSAPVTYTLPTGCRTTAMVLVNPLPLPVTGAPAICQGATTVFSDATPGGTWVSGNPSVAIADGSSGIIMGASAGTAVISYVLGTGCSSVATISVNVLLPVEGPASFCASDTAFLSNGVAGGVWSSSMTTVATISPAGAAYGVAAGIAVVSYTLPSGCVAAHVVTVHQLPASYPVTGGGMFCAGSPVAPIGLGGSAPGIIYRLYNGAAPAASVTATGGPISFGAHTVAGTYTVQAVNPSTGCRRPMAGAAVVTPVTPAPAGITITSPTGDTACSGSAILLSAAPVMGGAAPTYEWRVNGTAVSAASTYAYLPAHGDVVTCKLTSSFACAVPAVATATKHITVLPMVVPEVSVAIAPDTKVCAAVPVTFTASPVNGGATPAYQWRVNSAVAGVGATYTYLPANGDVVQCFMASSARCRTTDTVAAPAIIMEVIPQLVPLVTVNASPGFNVAPGSMITFGVTALNAGAAPAYQWKINTTAITGATNATFTWGVFAGNDVVSCDVTSSGECGGVTATGSGTVTFTTAVATSAIRGALSLSPNPNAGVFTLNGSLPAAGDSRFSLSVTNMLGQVVYSGSSIAKNGRISEQLSTGAEPNGMYLLTLCTADGERYIFHFVVAR